MTERIEFYGNVKGNCPEFVNYIEELGTNLNPFDCPFLRVLPQDAIVLKYENDGPPSRYKKGDLMCTERAKQNVSRRCKGLSKPRIDDEGNYCGSCSGDWPFEGGEIVLKLVQQEDEAG